MRIIKPTKSWLSINWRDVVRILTIVGVALLTAFLINTSVVGASQSKTNTRLLSNQAQIIAQLLKSGQDRTKAIASLKADNAQQTVILCTLILSDHTLSNDDTAKIEKICKQRIKDANAASQTSSAASVLQSPSPHKFSSSTPLHAKHTPPPPTTQSNPPQSVVRRVITPPVKAIESIVNGIINLL